MASIIVKPDGTPITKSSGFCSLCNAIRKTEIGLGNCMISDAAIGKMVKDGPTIQRCLSGHLLDAGASIIVDDQHVGSWLIGQVILEGDSEDKMLEYADKVGISRETYLKLLSNVKRISYEQFENLGRFLYINAKYLSEIALQKLTLTKEIALRIEHEKHIIYLENHDQLTYLFNRKYYEDHISTIDLVENLPISLVMIDVNGLKLINNAFGYQIGNSLLVKMSNVLKRECEGNLLISRMSSSGFLVVYSKISQSDLQVIIQRISEALSLEYIENIQLSVSIGWAIKNDIFKDINEVYKLADKNMLKEKLIDKSSMINRTIEIIMNSLYEKNEREMHHSKRVSVLCEKMAIKMNMSQTNVQKLRIAGLLHDIGKIGISEDVLNKAGDLTDREWIELKRHSEAGYRILGSAEEFSEIADCVLTHHERWDGKGYPKGLEGNDIPLYSRIISVSDSYDAMTSDRAYRKAIGKQEALNELKKCSGTQFDPDIVNLFLDVVADEEADNEKINPNELVLQS